METGVAWTRRPVAPFIALEQAVERLRQADAYEQGISVPLVTSSGQAAAWGLASKSSTITQILSALRQYGMIEKVKDSSGWFRITLAGKRLLNSEGAEFANALVEAALRPLVHRALFNLFVAEPRTSENAAIRFLEEDYRSQAGATFGEDSARAAFQVYNRTLVFVNSHPQAAKILKARMRGVDPAPSLGSAEFTESFLDESGSRIVLSFETKPTAQAYRFLKEYAEFKIAQLSKKIEG